MENKSEHSKVLKKVGMAIRARRLELGWTLEEVEGRGYPSWRHLQKVEAGKNITVETLVRVAEVLRTKPSAILRAAGV